MAEIVLMPPSMDPTRSNQLVTLLISAIEGGADLGPRGPHIRAVSQTVEHLLESLQAQIDAAMANTGMDEVARWETRTAIDTFVALVKKLIAQAQIYSV